MPLFHFASHRYFEQTEKYTYQKYASKKHTFEEEINGFGRTNKWGGRFHRHAMPLFHFTSHRYFEQTDKYTSEEFVFEETQF